MIRQWRCVMAMKQQVYYGLSLDDAYVIEHECSARVMRSKDAREGPRAFAEKREPVYTGE